MLMHTELPQLLSGLQRLLKGQLFLESSCSLSEVEVLFLLSLFTITSFKAALI